MKSCTNPNCDQINPQELSSFYKRKASRDGLHPLCKMCKNISIFDYLRAKSEKIKARQVARSLDNYEKVKVGKDALYYLENREKIKIAQAIYRLENPERVRAVKAAYEKANPGKMNAKAMKRHAAKLKATPKWLTKEQLKEIEAFYIEAARLTKETGIPHEVDHMIPLQGEQVRGLHVPWNLQILTKSENCKKSNKIIV